MTRPYLTSEERILFMRRLSLFLRAGIPIHAAFDLLTEGVRRPAGRHLLASIAEQIRIGRSLADALIEFPRTFDALTVGFIRMGEASGSLADHAAHVADLLQRRAALTRMILNAAIYPLIIMAATLGITGFLTLYAFPKILPLFKGFHRALPLPTRVLIWVTDLVTHHGISILILMAFGIASALYLQRFTSVRVLRDRLVQGLPFFGTMITYYYTATIARTLSALVERGVPLMTATELVSISVRHTGYAAALTRMRSYVSEGKRMSEEFAAHPDLFPTLLTQMTQAGEMTGTVPESLRSCAQIYEQYLEERTRMLATLIEPALMIVMGVIVGFVALAIITPIYGLTQGLDLH